MLLAGKTAGRLLLERADASKKNMGLTTFYGSHPASQEVKIAKNYLTKHELDKLKTLVQGFLSLLESATLARKSFTLQEFSRKLGDCVMITEHPELPGHGDGLLKAQGEVYALGQFAIYKNNHPSYYQSKSRKGAFRFKPKAALEFIKGSQ